MPYFKADCNLVESSLLAQRGFEGLGVFMYLCAKADKNGWTTVSLPAIARDGGISVEKAKEHLDALAAPDPYSRTPDDEGRRIRIESEPEWGIQIVNYQRNREKDHTSAERQRRYKARQKERLKAEGAAEERDSRVRSRKTEDTGQKTDNNDNGRGEPKVPHTPPVGGERLIAKRFISNFNWATGRSCQTTSMVTKKIKSALSKGMKGDEILALPFIHAELNQRRREKRTLEPDWLLRDGARNTHDWISEAMRQAGELELQPRLWKAAEQAGMVEILKTLGIKQARE